MDRSQTAEEKIAEYGEFHMRYPRIAGLPSLSVDGLIESHKRQREIITDLTNAVRGQQRLVMEKAYDDAYKFAHEHEWFSKEVLKSMTLQELAVVLIEDPD